MRLPKYLQENIKKKANKKEKKFYKHLCSGAFDFFKGDFSNDKYIIEYKSPTKKKSFRITEKMLEKLNIEALEMIKEPLFILEFSNYILVGKIVKK